MNEAASTPEHAFKTPGSLQGVLRHLDGSMASVAVPLPLPEAIVCVDDEAQARVSSTHSHVERWFWRERSSDSVLRYVEDERSRAATAPRHCAKCGERQSVYFVHKPAQGATTDAEQRLLCAECYPKESTSAS